MFNIVFYLKNKHTVTGLLTSYTVSLLDLFVLYRQLFEKSNVKRTPYSFELGIVQNMNGLSIWDTTNRGKQDIA